MADTRAAGGRVQVVLTGSRRQIPPGLDLAAYRVAQEALTNVLRHARPPCARLAIEYAPAELTIDITDEGADGVDHSGSSTGRGIQGMRERVALYGGDLTIGP